MRGGKQQRLVFIPVIVSLLLLVACMGASPPVAPGISPIIIKQSGGAGALIAECRDKAYLSRSADYIVEGTVTSVVSRWNEDKTGIFTYSDFTAAKYLKGKPLPVNTFQIVTPGGTVGDITQAVEDQPIFHEGRKVRLYLREVNREFSIICGRFGVEDLESLPLSTPASRNPTKVIDG